MSNSMLSNQRLTLKSHIPISFGVGDTFKIFETGLDVVEGSIVFSNKVQLERLVVNIDTDGTCEIVMRGLDNTEIKNQVSSLKRDRDVGASGYITVLASDIFDKDSELPQTMKSPLTFEKEVTFEDAVNFDKGFEMTGPVKPFPQVDDETERDNMYPNPTGGEVAIVGGYLQIFNPETQQRETLDIGTPLPDATETIKGKIRIATEAEATAGELDNVAITPKKMQKGLKEAGGYLTEQIFMAGEKIEVDDSVFLEKMIDNSDLTEKFNFGIESIKRIALVGVFEPNASSIEIKIGRVGIPEYLKYRIESDDNFQPSGNLFSGATEQTVITSNINENGNLLNIDVSGLDIQGGEIFWIVLYVGTYGSETYDASKYYQIYTKDEKTAGLNSIFYWNGINYVSEEVVSYNETFGTYDYPSSGGSINYYDTSIDITVDTVFRLIFIQSAGVGGERKIYIYDDNDILLHVSNLIGGGGLNSIAYLEEYYDFTQIGDYKITVKGIDSLALITSFTGGQKNGFKVNSSSNKIGGLGILMKVNLNYYSHKCYIGGDTKKEFLKKTDATYDYKLPQDGTIRLSQQTANIGEIPVLTYFGEHTFSTNIAHSKTHFLQDTPGKIGITPGTHKKTVGWAINARTIYIKKYYDASTNVGVSTNYSIETSSPIKIGEGFGNITYQVRNDTQYYCIVEYSNDGLNWSQLHRRNGNNDYKTTGTIHTTFVPGYYRVSAKGGYSSCSINVYAEKWGI